MKNLGIVRNNDFFATLSYGPVINDGPPRDHHRSDMAPQADLTENDRRLLSEPYNPIYNLIPVTPVIVKQCVTPQLTFEAQETWMLTLD